MIVAGFGFSTTATVGSLQDALREAIAACATYIAPGHLPERLATAEDKAQSPAFTGLGDALTLPLAAIPATQLAEQATLTRSARSLAERGTGSVAEASALAAAGPAARLLGPRMISNDRLATCALAVSKTEGQHP